MPIVRENEKESSSCLWVDCPTGVAHDCGVGASALRAVMTAECLGFEPRVCVVVNMVMTSHAIGIALTIQKSSYQYRYHSQNRWHDDDHWHLYQ